MGLVGSDKHYATGCGVGGDGLVKAGTACAVQAIIGFVEQPDIRLRREHACDTGAFALAGRQETHGHLRQTLQIHVRQCHALRVRSRAVHIRPEHEGFFDCQICIKREIFIGEGNPAFRLYRTGCSMQKTGDEPKQRFAATICATDPNDITAARSDRQPAQHKPVAADNRDIVNADGRQGCLT